MKNIFVGNMSFQTTETELRELFEPFGQVTRVHIAHDRETGQARGFAFVEMAQDDQAAKAITDLNGKEVSGRALRVNEAAPKPDRPRGGFGAGGGGYNKGGGGGGGYNKGGGGGGRRGGFSTEDYRGAARQPKEPRW